MPPWARPEARRLVAQSEALAPLRSRLLRRVQIATRAVVVDLGAGCGAVTAELVRRSATTGPDGPGRVVAVDAAPDFLALDPAPFAGAERVRASADALPLADRSVDLVFCQLALLWMPLDGALDEVARVLAPGGAVVALEPDLTAMIEWPDRGARALWCDALRAAGADPAVGRKLPGALHRRGFAVRVEVMPELAPTGGLEMLDGLPLSPEQRAARDGLRGDPPSWQTLRWAPTFGITATR